MRGGSSPRGRGKPPGYSPGKDIYQAHPRVGGENRDRRRYRDRSAGSSPRGRGKRSTEGEGRRRDRLIPAWAGKTASTPRAGTSPAAHPRVGGENSTTPGRRLAETGSSPRGRGKRRNSATPNVRWGLIPAWAGKTYPKCPRPIGGRAHPRVGGENQRPPALRGGQTGSSPRGRGKPRISPVNVAPPGLIPAWAGKTQACFPDGRRYRAHPRVGGENLSEYW